MAAQKHCLITGGAGFIGSHLCDRLLKDDCLVTAIDDLSLGQLSNLSKALDYSGFHFIEGDILASRLLDSVFRNNKFDIVFHMAANSDIQRGGEETDRDLELTFLTTFRVLEAMRRYDVHDLVFASSSAIYGEVKTKINEDHGPLQPISFYGAAKLSAEAYISAFAHYFGLCAWIYRFPNVVGARLTHGVLYDFIESLRGDCTRLRILGDGKQRKPYLHVDDLIDAILLCFKKLQQPVNCINVGGQTDTSVTRIAEIVVEEMGFNNVKLHYTGGNNGWKGDVPFYQYDLSRITKLGWKAQYSSDEAVRKSAREVIIN